MIIVQDNGTLYPLHATYAVNPWHASACFQSLLLPRCNQFYFLLPFAFLLLRKESRWRCWFQAGCYHVHEVKGSTFLAEHFSSSLLRTWPFKRTILLVKTLDYFKALPQDRFIFFPQINHTGMYFKHKNDFQNMHANNANVISVENEKWLESLSMKGLANILRWQINSKILSEIFARRLLIFRVGLRICFTKTLCFFK